MLDSQDLLHSEYVLIDKLTGEVVDFPLKEINNDTYEEFDIDDERYLYVRVQNEWKSLQDIWNCVKRPFIAQSKDDWYVIIYKSPERQAKKYNDNVYGKIHKSLTRLILSDKSREIGSWAFEIWKFISILC